MRGRTTKAPKAALIGLLSLCAIALALSVAGASAQASEEHPYLPAHSLIDQFTRASACGVTTDSVGDVYVADYSTHKVSIYSPAPGASKITEFEVPGFGNGPCGIAVDPKTGALYVEEFKGKVVKEKPSSYPPEASTTYALEESAGASGVIVPKANHTRGIAFDSANQRLYVAEANISEIQEYTVPKTSYKLKFESCETASLSTTATLGEITAALEACTGAGSIALESVSGTKKLVYFRGALARKDVPLLEVVTSVHTPAKTVENGATSKVSSYQPNGTLVSNEIGRDLAPGHEYFGVGVDENNGDVYVTDTANARAYILNPEGTAIVQEITGAETPSGQLSKFIYGLAVDQSDGNLFIYYSPANQVPSGVVVYEFAPSGAYLSEIGPKFDSGLLHLESFESDVVAVDNGASSPNKGDVYVASQDQAHEADSVYAFGPALPKYPLSLSTSGSGTGSLKCSENGGTATTCLAKYVEGAEVEVVPTAAAGSEFVEWSGDCSGAGACVVTMGGPKQVTAKFAHEGLPLHKLTVSVTGEGKVSAGSGTISGCTSAGGPSCEGEYEEGAHVLLTETPGPNAEFTGWQTLQCDESIQSTCEIAIGSGDEAVAASFKPKAKPKFKLTVSKTGSGQGTLTSTPAAINCGTGAGCEAEYEEGTEVELHQSPAAGSEFKEWSGACSGTGTCKVTMSAAKAVGAKFEPIPRTLAISKAGTGTGEVKCKANGGSAGACAASYPNATALELIATANAGSSFAGFSSASGSAAACAASPCSFTIEANSAVTATFNLVVKPKFKLTVSKTGSGTLTSTPAGINCGSGAGCEAEFEEGTEVELHQSPAAGSEFKEWSGVCTGTGTCKVTMSAAKAVGAKFEPIPRTLAITKAGTGTGEVKCKANGGSAGACAASYPNATALELIATANAGSSFAGFSAASGSAASCAASPCAFTIEANSAVTATFNLVVKPKFALKVKKTGSGTGKVESTSPLSPKISCGTECEKEFEEGTKVTLAQSADPGSKFIEWSGACTGTGTCEVTMSAAKEVTAHFDLVPKFKLTVSKSGTGAGTVTSSPAGISCGATCSAEFEEGKEVELKEAPEAGSEFVKWTGACSGAGSCKVTMSAAKEAGAEFKLLPKPKFKLSVTKPGTGTGTVTSTPAGISCGATCSAEYEEGKVVELSETASAGSQFVEWSGACAGTGTCKVTMNTARSVAARFDLVPEFKLTVTKYGSGQGTIASSPSGIECGGACKAEFETGTEVELTASAEEGSEFLRWGGACSGTGSCQVTMSAAKSVSAIFKATPTYKLTVTKSGTGTGKVASLPPVTDIDCGLSCEARFPAGTEVELTATPGPGSEFFKWSGACAGTGPCKVTMSSAKTVHATFKATPKFMLSVTKTGSGTVTGSPAGIECGTQCAHEYSAGTAVTLTATPARGYRFQGFAGCDGSTGATCTLTIDSSRSVSATFVLAKCKKGFHRRKVNGKPRCVRTRRHTSHPRGARNSLALPAFWP